MCRHHDCFDRVQLASAIRKAYTFGDTSEPAHVQHWETLANISEYLHPYTADFAKGCMKYRHVRFKRSTTDRKVWMQVAESMGSAANPNDEWRGLTTNSTHTIPFNTSLGVPNLMTAFNTGQLPASRTREFNEDEHKKMVTGCKDMHTFFDNFSNESLDDCLHILQLFKDPPRPFPWTRDDMESLYGKGPGAGLSADVVAAQQSRGLPVGQVGQLYLVKPDDDEEDTFILGIIRALAKDNKGEGGVLMQFFQHAQGACKYTSAYSSVLPSGTKCDRFPFVYDAALQYKMKGAKFRKVKSSGVVTSFCINANEVKDVKYYEARFANGEDLRPCAHELPLSEARIHRAGHQK